MSRGFRNSDSTQELSEQATNESINEILERDREQADHAAKVRATGGYGVCEDCGTRIALVAILILGYRVWPAITIAAFAINLPLGPNALGAAVIAGGNTLAPLTAAFLMKRAGFRLELDRLRDAASVIVLGALVGMSVSATIGSLVL